MYIRPAYQLIIASRISNLDTQSSSLRIEEPRSYLANSCVIRSSLAVFVCMEAKKGIRVLGSKIVKWVLTRLRLAGMPPCGWVTGPEVSEKVIV